MASSRRLPDEIVRFRVAQAGPNPRRERMPLPPSEAMAVRIECVNRPDKITFAVSAATFDRYRDALARAVASQAVYWVDWSWRDSGFLDPSTTSSRMLDALAANQIVSVDPEPPSPPIA